MRFNTTDFTPSDDNTPASIVNLAPLNQALVEFTAKKAEFNQLKQNLINDFRVSLETMAKDIFIHIPQLKAISWQQYTPYFNDGDECTFRIREIIFYNFIPQDGYFRYAEEMEDEHEGEYPEGSWAYSSSYLKKTTLSKEAVEFLNNFNRTINQNREFIKEIFNDNSTISWTENGIEIEEYSDHD